MVRRVPAATADPHDDLRGDLVVAAVGWLVVAAGVAFVVVRTLNSEPPVRRDVEALAGSIAFGVVIGSPGMMALFARFRRPALVLPAAIVLVPFSFLSFAGVLLPLLVPAFLLTRSYLRHRRLGEGLLDAAVAIGLVTVSIAAIAVLLSDTTEKVYRTATTTHSTSMPSLVSATTAIGLVVAALGLAWWATTPRDRR
jgi:hypothetical protein